MEINVVNNTNKKKVIKLKVWPSEIIYCLKHSIDGAIKRVDRGQGITIKRRGKELLDTNTFRSYDIKNGDTLQADASRDNKPFTRYVYTINVTKNGSKQTKTFRLEPIDKIRKVKVDMFNQKASESLLNQQIILFDGEELDDDRSIASYNIGHGDTIHMYDKQAIGYGSDMRIFATYFW